uniref:Eukaryotic translation initiation factor 2A n=1 Tax=Panagrellus redivivus TaxID=6233 RepID=A0A7E4VEP9_PANRE
MSNPDTAPPRKRLHIDNEQQENELSNDFHDVELRQIHVQSQVKPAKIASTVSEEKQPNFRQLSAEAGGHRRLKSIHGTFLRALEESVVLAPAPATKSDNWYVEDWNGKVVFKTYNEPGRFLNAFPDGSVDYTYTLPKMLEQWVPYCNDDGTWSFQSHHGQWLSAGADGRVCTVKEKGASEDFWLLWWN